MGIALKKFEHYSFESGENKGQPPTALSKSELDRTLNVENRGNGISTRYGSTVLNVDGSGYPSPIAAFPEVNSIQGFQYGTNSYDSLFTVADAIYRQVSAPVSLKTGLATGLDFQQAQAGDILYLTNGTDPVQYYDPNRSTTQTYTAGYDTPAAFVATPQVAGGFMTAGTYGYFVVLSDLNTETKSNRQDTAVTAVVAGPNSSVDLSDLPLDPEDRSTHWIIYRLDPSGYYYFKIDMVPYNAGAPTYTDVFASTGTSEVIQNDNDRPDPSTGMVLHDKVMVYFQGNDVSWSKNYRFQDVPTFNRETLDDNSQAITKCISFRKTLVVFKTDSIFIFSGDLNGNYTISKISNFIGTRSPDTVKEGPDGIFFLDSNGRPRFINSTDFSVEDLRDSTDIAYKYRKKFDSIPRSQYANCFAIIWETSAVSQYRIFVPIESVNDTCDHCYVFDYGLARRNGGDSAWFDLKYNISLKCATVVTASGGEKQIYAGDNYGLIWQLDRTDVFYDGAEFFRAEFDDAITVGANTIDMPSLTMGVNQCAGMQVIVYDSYTYDEIYRSKIVSNTATEITTQDVIPDLGTEEPAVTVGGYLTYFATANYTHDRAGRNRPFKASVLFDQVYHATTIQFFINYDFNQTFNYTYHYLNSPTNESRTPLSDTYDLLIGEANSFYDSAIYDESPYGSVLYGSEDFLLNSKYLFAHASWGVITREPSQPFGYLGATVYYQPKGLTR